MNTRARLRGCDGRKGASPMPLVLVVSSLLLVLGDCKELRSRTKDEAFIALSDNGLDGYFVVSGNTPIAEEMAFKERLISLLRTNDQSLARLQTHDITAYTTNPHGQFWSYLSQRHVLAEGSAVRFVPDQMRLDFSTNFNHSRGISQRALQKSLKHIADTGAGALVSTASNMTRRLSETDRPCDESKHNKACDKSCAGYMFPYCDNCKCDAKSQRGGTPQCICVLHAAIFYNLAFSNSIYAVFMLIFGLCARSAVIKHLPLEQPWPNVGGQEFESDVLSCCTNMNITFMTCCCPAVRIAMTYYWAGWSKGYVCWLVILCLVFAAPGNTGSFLLLIVLFVGRRIIRKNGTLNKDMCGDICCICCCSYCIMCQEARHIDKCMEEVNKKKLKESGDLVGMAVALEDKM